MLNSNDLLWLAWAEKTIQIVGAMQFNFDIDIDTYARCYHDTPDGELLVVIIAPKKDDFVTVDLYGVSGSQQPISHILMLGDEVRVGGHGTFHRFSKSDVPEIVDFLLGIRKNVLSSSAYLEKLENVKMRAEIETR
jgi:hypothetical protein